MADIRSISTGLKLGENGIWYSTDTENISYPQDGNEDCFAIEDTSFWFRHRNNCIVSIVKFYPPENNGTIFDIGGGNGFVSLGLANAGFDVALVEPGTVGASKAKNRGIKDVICATTNIAKFKQHSLPAVGLFDVIEHIEDDITFLQAVRGLMKKKGRLYVTVPSYPFLWSAEDVSAGHFRRYTLEDISNVLKSAGFEVEFSSYIFRFLPIPVFLLRTLPYKLGLSKVERKNNTTSRDHAVKGGIWGNIINSLLQSEIDNLNNKKAMSFGGSCLIVAKSP
ncbi:MAG: class I SAM-dependent methyltransferase [Nitrospinae bacterium]|nr:class I SAM-dependent methyltransferase [Nitrospinota bacterium]